MKVGEILRQAGNKKLIDSVPGSLQAISAANMVLPDEVNLEAAVATGDDVLEVIEILDDSIKIKLLNLEIIPPAKTSSPAMENITNLMGYTMAVGSLLSTFTVCYVGARNLVTPDWTQFLIPLIGPLMVVWYTAGVLKTQAASAMVDQIKKLPGGDKVSGVLDSFVEPSKENKQQ